MTTITILGSGNVAHHLIRSIQDQDHVELQQIYARNIQDLKDMVCEEKLTNDIANLKPADIFILAVSDDAIREVSEAINIENQLVVHVSGTVPLEAIASKHRKGVFYMLQTFSKDKPLDFSQIPFCIEAAESKDLNTLEKLALLFSERVYVIDSKQRKQIHLAAVFVSNFSNHMYVLGEEICKENQIPFDILKPLIIETAKKIEFITPKEAQTGPAVRRDQKTIENHLSYLEQDKIKKKIYSILTQSIQDK